MPAYYAATVANFRAASLDSLELILHKAYEQDRYKDLITSQITAWRRQLQDLKEAFAVTEAACCLSNNWGIAIEFVVPRKMGRIDTVLLIGTAIVVLEFKTENADSSAADQVEDYCLDLLHFHASSHGRVIYPVVVSKTGGESRKRRSQAFGELRPTTFVGTALLGKWLNTVALEHSEDVQLPIDIWNEGNYRPVPTIVEAAIGMFAEMQVADIAKSGCDPINLSSTVDAIREIVADTARSHKKTLCLVTGVPGAGKTLAGLKLVHDPEIRDSTGSDSIFLTGNLPLVRVLQSALARDIMRRKRGHLRVSARDPKTTINTVLGYKKAHTGNKNAPHERIVVFDEAQRAWDSDRTAEYLTDASSDFLGYSEPALMLAILDRQPWAVLIALVGGGQEINRGEAGLSEWGRALTERFPHWCVAAPPQALSGAYGAGAKLFVDGPPVGLKMDENLNLHLDTPTRQFRGKTVAAWAEAVLRGDAQDSRKILTENPEYPVRLTRRLVSAKSWLDEMAHGTERYGFIASSEAKRLRAEGLELPPARADGVEHWFLEPRGDVRSSFQLEVAANEFQIQGLELDWTCLCWGGDFLRVNGDWELKRLRGTAWQRIGQVITQQYLINSYRVLLTRARQGMLLFVPVGDANDSTRPAEPFDRTADFLTECGAVPL